MGRYKTILNLAGPVIVSQVGLMVVSLVDTMMVGQLGSVPLAGVSFANALFWPVMLMGMGVAMGLTPLTTRAYVRENESRIKSLLKNSFLLNMVLGVVLTLILSALTLAMPLMGQDAAVVEIATPFSWLMVASIVPMMAFYTMRQLLEGLGNTTSAMVITVTANLANIGMNYVFIYGYLGMPAMGAFGAGLATLISRFMMVGLFALLIYRKDKFNYYFTGFWKERVQNFRLLRLWRLGYPIAMQIGVEMTAISLMAIVIGTFGAVELAAHQIAINLPTMAFMFTGGIASALSILVARNYALKLYDEVKALLRAAQVMIVGFMIFFALLVVIFAHPIVSIFTPDSGAQAVAAHLLLFAVFFQISDGIQGVTIGALRGLMDVKRPMYYAMGVYLVVGGPIAYLCGFVLDMEASGIWIGFISGLTALAILLNRRFNWFLKRHEV